MHLGDYALETTIHCKFTTRSFSTGAPTQLAGTPAVEIYEDSSTTQITAAETLTVDFDAITGLNHLAIAATAANGFEAGKFYQAVISAGTVGGVSVVGEVVASFTIQATSALRPTVAGRTLDVSAGGEAGVDWANVGSPTTSVALTGTTIAVTQKVDVDTIKTNPVANGGTVTFPTNATLASTTNITAGTLTTVTNLTNAPTAGDLTATMKTSVTTAATAATPTVTLAASAVQAIWDALTSALTTAGSIGKLLVDNINATISSRLATAGYTAPDNTSITAIKAKTDLIPGTQDGLTFAQVQMLTAAVLLGKASGLGTTTAVYRSTDDGEDRVTATVDADGNRSAVTLNTA